jgi:hypothetical protein
MRIKRKNNRKIADCPLVLMNKVVSLISTQAIERVIVRIRAIPNEGSFGKLV